MCFMPIPSERIRTLNSETVNDGSGCLRPIDAGASIPTSVAWNKASKKSAGEGEEEAAKLQLEQPE
jgi:hypothetical protein